MPRKPTEIPLGLVKELLRAGLSKKDVYRVLVSQGYLRYREKGETRTMSYEQFLRRLRLLEHVEETS